IGTDRGRKSLHSAKIGCHGQREKNPTKTRPNSLRGDCPQTSFRGPSPWHTQLSAPAASSTESLRATSFELRSSKGPLATRLRSKKSSSLAVKAPSLVTPSSRAPRSRERL